MSSWKHFFHTGLVEPVDDLRASNPASNPELLELLQSRGIVVFGADLWASDWNPMTPDQTLDLTLRRLTATGGGILLFHDTQPHTAAMLPGFLREMKRRGFNIVHVVPAPH